MIPITKINTIIVLVTIFMLLGIHVRAASTVGEGSNSDPDTATIYSPVGKRDPFKPPSNSSLSLRSLASTEPIERVSIEQLTLRGILREGKQKARAMFEDSTGNTYIVREGDRIGREQGTVSRILNREVIITERTFNYLGAEHLYEKVLSLPQ